MRTITRDLIMSKTCASAVNNLDMDGKNRPNATAKETPVHKPVWRNMDHRRLENFANRLKSQQEKATLITLRAE